MFLPTIHILCIFVLCAILAYLYSRTAHRVLLTTLGEVRGLLKPPHSSLSSLLKARAVPNARLRRAFGINSTFVNPSVDVHTSFVAHVAKLICPLRLPWTNFSEVAHHAVEIYLPLPDESGLYFDVFIRRVTMYCVLVGILGANVDGDSRDIDLVTRGINTLWAMSKSSSDLPPTLLDEVNYHIRRWLPDQPNPLELVIPAYETLWRVVAVGVAVNCDDYAIHDTFRDFLIHPTTTQFRQYTETGPSAEAVIQEILRLYPPTRRISRAVSVPYIPFLPAPINFLFTHRVIKAADVEQLQRDHSIWGLDAETFDPMRHHPGCRTDEQQQSMLAFGSGRLACVAKNWAPQAAAIVIAAILERVGAGTSYAVISGGEVGGREGWDDWMVRRSSTSLCL